MAELMKPNHLNPGSDGVQELFDDHRIALMQYGLSLASRDRVEDGIQDLFLKLCQSPQLISRMQDPLSYLKTSLRRSLLKTIIEERKNTGDLSQLREIGVISFERKLIEKQSTEDRAQKVQSALAQLSAGQRTILAMRFYRGMSYDDIAAKLDITKRTVYNQVHNSMCKLRGLL